MAAPTLTLRGELRCFSCARFLGDFESHPDTHGRGDIHLIKPEFGELPASPVQSEKGPRLLSLRWARGRRVRGERGLVPRIPEKQRPRAPNRAPSLFLGALTVSLTRGAP